MIEQDLQPPQVPGVLVFFQPARGDGIELRRAGAARGDGEALHPLAGGDERAEVSAGDGVDIGLEPVVSGDRDLSAIVRQRLNAGEAVVAPEPCLLTASQAGKEPLPLDVASIVQQPFEPAKTPGMEGNHHLACRGYQQTMPPTGV
jgi:hypothetical protein